MAVIENRTRLPWINQFTGEPQAVDYQDDRIERLLEITKNLENFYNENPDLFKNEEEFKKNFHFNERSPLQQGVLQGFFNKNVAGTATPADTNEDIFWDTAWEAVPEDNGNERDALVWGGSMAEEPKAQDLSSEAANVKKDMAKRETDEAQKNIDEWTQFATPAPDKEWKAEENKPARRWLKEWLSSKNK